MALLSVGSKANPRDDVLQLGDAGAKQLVQVKQEGEKGGLSVFLEQQKALGANVLGEGGMPPLPPTAVGAKPYTLMKDQSYGTA